jgi:hypothetical protein
MPRPTNKRQRLHEEHSADPAWWKAALPDVLWDIVFDNLTQCEGCCYGLTLDPFVVEPLVGLIVCHRETCGNYQSLRRDAGAGKYVDSDLVYDACGSCASHLFETCACSRP